MRLKKRLRLMMEAQLGTRGADLRTREVRLSNRTGLQGTKAQESARRSADH